ncbi:LAETG motif-containing sortase-dependent surface protein [Streptomyces chattanoogensis]|uniref:LAETG motif-containing sortase-dependent surface protein n=1 Tax=Streptomyces chattanoogensis TaxID=66876 RepID=UPI000A96E4C0|nr:LAETG motif-containing sortase-dependent surface protein [Streptomyces chattanoogensis]
MPTPEGLSPAGAVPGADATPWLLGGAGLLLAAGAGAFIVARRCRVDDSNDDGSANN